MNKIHIFGFKNILIKSRKEVNYDSERFTKKAGFKTGFKNILYKRELGFVCVCAKGSGALSIGDIFFIDKWPWIAFD